MNKPQEKGYGISKTEVMEAWKRVKANRGAAGIDEETIKDFERNLKDNLYKIWNRMTSGSYFPPPVLTVEIPKAGGGKRKLGIPTVGDRVAQMVVKMHLEPRVEPKFHPDSYEFRAREAKSFRGRFVSFLPAISEQAIKEIREEIQSWKLHLKSDTSLEELSRKYNPVVRGWVQYYGRYYRSRLDWVFAPLEGALIRWACRKYKKLQRHAGRASYWLRRISKRAPDLFAHWQIAVTRPVSSMGAV